MAAGPQATAKPATPQVLQLDFKATVQADGSVTDIEPDATLPEPIKTMIRTRVATWRFNPPQWKGKAAASTRIQQSIKAVPVATAQGGFVLRIGGVTGPVEVDSPQRGKDFQIMPPRYPSVLQRRGVNAVLIYAVLFDEAGKPLQVDLVYPSERNRDISRLDEVAREGIAKWTWPKTFEGKPISCREGVPVVFGADNALEQPHTHSGSGHAFDKYTDMCPTTTFLETPVKDTLL